MPKIGIPVVTVGSAGSATGNATAGAVREGLITHVVVPDLANTADLTLAEEQPDGTFVTVYTKTDITAQRYNILVSADKEDGTDAGQKCHPHVSGRLKATLAQDDAGTRNVFVGIIPI